MIRCAFLALAVVLPLGLHAQVPAKLGYQGRLLAADGTAETDVVDITFAVYDVETGGVAFWSETQSLALTNGFYSTFLGEVTPLDLSLFNGRDLWLELRVRGEALTPRQKIQSVAYALKANQAVNVSGGSVNASSISIGGATVIDSSGRLVGGAAYSAGDGLELSGNAFSLTQACATGEILKWDGAQWTCAVDAGGAGVITDVTTRAPLASTGGTSPELSLSQSGSATDGYLSAADWVIFNNKLGSVAASAPMSGLGTSASPLAVSRATSVADGYLAAADWVAFDSKVAAVTAGTGISVGGGATNPSVSAVYGTAAGTAAEGNDPRLSDARNPLPGSADYIQNQTATAQAASFDIAGTAAVGSTLTVQGNAGLGVATPAARLDVAGGLRLREEGVAANLYHSTAGGSLQLRFHSRANEGSDFGFLVLQDESASSPGTAAEDLRLTLGVFNDFRQVGAHSDELWLQGGGRLVSNVGSWDAEMIALVGTPGVGTTGGYEWRVNDTPVMTLSHAGNASVTGTVTAPTFSGSLACPAGWNSIAGGRLCHDPTARGPSTMHAAIAVCTGLQARVCTHTDMQQACGAVPNPYAGAAVNGWYGNHAKAEPAGNTDDEFLTFNRNFCDPNNDGPAMDAATTLHFFCCQ